jgi:phage gp36-like protein
LALKSLCCYCLRAKTSYHRRCTELIVRRFEVELKVKLKVKLKAKLEVGLEAKQEEVESSIEVMEALDEFEGCEECNNSVDWSIGRME